MGEVLFLAHRVPWPPDRGDRIRSYHVLRHLAGLATVHVGGFEEGSSPAKAGVRLPVSDWAPAFAGARHMGEACLVARPFRLASAVRGLATGAPLSVAAFDSPAMHAFVRRILTDRPIDAIYAFSGQMAQFVPADFTGRFVMDFVDVDSAKFEAYAAQERGPMAWLHRREGHLLARYERAVAARADVSLLVSEAESDLFRARTWIDAVATLGNGIDLAHYDPSIAAADADAGAGPLILFTGQMDYRPNIAAVIGFAREALPLIRARFPDARFAIVGRNPPGEVRGLAGEGVIVTGEVPDVRPWLARADAVVAPLRLARGVQNKVLEAMAMARPVVASPAAFEGIDAMPERELVVADGAAAEAEAVCGLLADRERADALGRAARRRVEERYGWDAALAPLGAMLRLEAPPSRTRRRA